MVVMIKVNPIFFFIFLLVGSKEDCIPKISFLGCLEVTVGVGGDVVLPIIMSLPTHVELAVTINPNSIIFFL